MFPQIEISFEDVEESAAIHDLVDQHARRLAKFAAEIVNGHLVVERSARVGMNPFRVRLHLTIRSGRQLVIIEGGDQEMHTPLAKIIDNAFKTAEQRVKELCADRKTRGRSTPIVPQGSKRVPCAISALI